MDAKTHPSMQNAAQSPRVLVAVASVILSMALIAVGNGLMFAYIPVRLGADGFAPTWAGGILTGLSAGGIAGCLLTGTIVRRIGHARAYMVLSALIVLSNAGIAAKADPIVWIAARALYGFAICALFIVSQSWLNDAVGNAIRGRVMAVFYVSYVVGHGARLVHDGLARHRHRAGAVRRHRLHRALHAARRPDAAGAAARRPRPRRWRCAAPGRYRRSASPACSPSADCR